MTVLSNRRGRQRHATVRIVAGAVLAGLLAAACGGEDDDKGAATPTAATTAAGQSPPGASASGAPKVDLSKDSFTFVSFGGAYQDAQKKAMVDPYVAMGAKVTLDESTDYAKIKTMVESNNVTWDVVDADPFFPIANCGKYAEKLDTTVIDTSKMDKALVSECAVPAMTYSYILAYNPEKYSTPPSGWADFFDTAKFPGKRALQNAVQGGAYEVALLADGVAPDALYPIDYDRAFKKLDTIKKDLVYWDKGAQSQEMAEKGEVDMMLIWNGRAFNAAKAGSKMKPAWKQSITVYDVFMIPKGSKNKDAAMRFIAYATGKEPQERLAQNIPYAPIHADAKPVVDELTKAYLPSENADGAVVQDQKWYSENETEATKRWEAYVAG